MLLLQGAELEGVRLDNANLNGTVLPKLEWEKISMNDKTHIYGVFTPDADFLTNYYNNIQKNSKSKLDKKKYQLIKLTPNQIIEKSKQNKYLRKWDLKQNLYQVQ